jgi:hypothetical protein
MEGDLAVFGLGLAQSLDGSEALAAQVGQDVFDAPQAVGPRLDAQTVATIVRAVPRLTR